MNFTKEQMSTVGGILALLIGIVVWDVFLARDGVDGNTISSVLKMLANCPTIPLFFGIIAGHAFWPKRGLRPAQQSTTGYVILIVAVIASYLWYNFSFGPVMSFLSNNPIAVFAAVGMPMGHLFWPQYTKEMGV